MLQRLAAWCYRRRRTVVVLWIVALVGVSVIGSNVGSSFSQGFNLSDTESAQAAKVLETRFPARAGDEGQIVFAHTGGVDDAAVQARVEQLFAEVAKVPGVTAVVSPYTADGARQVARSGDIAYATVQFDKQASKIPDSTIEHIRSSKPLSILASHTSDGAAIDSLLNDIDAAVDLAEPFARIREAVSEARTTGLARAA